MMAESSPLRGAGLDSVRGGIVALALATAIIHIVLAIPLTLVGFYLNGLGYIALVGALTVPLLQRYGRPIRWLFMSHTALTILLWVVLGQPYTTIGYADKAIEVTLVGLLLLDGLKSLAGMGTALE
ncbi:MAG: hypothetical protein IT305_08260 [Chloroflexi bacterium]|nr:hypothetical protein [Chloroflexota bacterium]